LSRGKQVDNAMSDVAIRVENLSKQYRIGTPQARYETMCAMMRAIAVKGKERVQQHLTWDTVAERVMDGYHRVR